MKVYRLHIAAGEYDADGENFDEWFLSLEMAMRRRRVLIREAEHPDYENLKYPTDFKIERYEVRKAPLRELVLGLLNGHGWYASREVVVVEYTIKRGKKASSAADYLT